MNLPGPVIFARGWFLSETSETTDTALGSVGIDEFPSGGRVAYKLVVIALPRAIQLNSARRRDPAHKLHGFKLSP